MCKSPLSRGAAPSVRLASLCQSLRIGNVKKKKKKNVSVQLTSLIRIVAARLLLGARVKQITAVFDATFGAR